MRRSAPRGRLRVPECPGAQRPAGPQGRISRRRPRMRSAGSAAETAGLLLARCAKCTDIGFLVAATAFGHAGPGRALVLEFGGPKQACIARAAGIAAAGGVPPKAVPARTEAPDPAEAGSPVPHAAEHAMREAHRRLIRLGFE